jgi:deazaflavin-dependent oxidoreductase (nitroreductase family)
MNEDLLRNLFKYFNKFMVMLWRLGLGKFLNIWPKVFGCFLVITHYGRKTRNKYLTPVNFSTVDGEIYCTSGFGEQSDWYKNLVRHPEIEVWLTEGWWRAQAVDVSDHPDRLDIMREVLIGSGFAAPMFGIHPLTMDNATLSEMTKEYRLIRINRIAEKTGNDGPGEYVWVWQITTAFLFFLLLTKKRRK